MSAREGAGAGPERGADRRVDAALRDAERRLREAGRGEAAVLARQVVAHVLDCTPPDLHLRARDAWGAQAASRLEPLLARLGRGEPLAYVVGDVDFRGHRICVDRRVLVPRPETEQLVQAVLDDADLWDKPSVRFADLGTGSGCIAVALALERGQARGVAVDASADALAVARANVEAHGVGGRVALRQAEWLDGQPDASLDIVVSNPPYVSAAEMAALPPEVRDFEPHAALCGGADGLEAYRRLVPESFRVLAGGGRLFLEIGAGQVQPVLALVAASGFVEVGCSRDHQGRDRIVRGRKP